MNLRQVLERLIAAAKGSIRQKLKAVLGLLAAALASHYCYILTWRKLRKLPPGPMPVPLLGNLLMLKSDDIAGEFLPLFKKYGPVFSFWFGNKHAVVHSDPAIDFELMVTRVDDFNARPLTELELQIIYSKGRCEGIHSSEGQQWNSVRKVLVQDLLSKKNLETRILPKTTQGARELVRYFRDKSGTVVSPRMLLKITAINASLKLILGITISYDELGVYDLQTNEWTHPKEMSESARLAFFFLKYIDSTFICLAVPNVRDVLPFPLSTITPRPGVFATFDELATERDAVWTKVIADARATRTKGSPRHWVDEILEKPRGLKDEEIIGLLMDTVIATSDTFIAFIEWMLGVVAQMPEEQRKLQAEFDRIAPDRLIDAKDQHDCTYFAAFMKEILRLYPLTPINPPRRAMVNSELGGYDVPNKSWVFQHWGAMHVRQDLWGADAHEFRPERFLNEAKEQGEQAMNTSAPNMPLNFGVFSFGKRSCPGYRLGRVSAFVQGAMLIQLYDWKLTEDSDMSRQTRLITFPKKLMCIPTYRHKIPLDDLLAKPADHAGAWF